MIRNDQKVETVVSYQIIFSILPISILSEMYVRMEISYSNINNIMIFNIQQLLSLCVSTCHKHPRKIQHTPRVHPRHSPGANYERNPFMAGW